MKEWGASCAVRPEKLSSKIVPTEGEASTSQIKSTPDGSTKARKGLTYSDGASGSASGGASVSPLQSFILHQKHMIEDQERTVYKIEKDSDNFVRDRTPKQVVLSTLPTCSKCHLKEGHNRLNCPYPSNCLSSAYCRNIDKHPDDKQTLKDLNKKLTEERRRHVVCKGRAKNKEQACESVKNRYITRVKETLIASNPEKYVREVDGKSIKNWRMINKDSKILEQQFKGKIPSPEDARTAIMSCETLVLQKKQPGKHPFISHINCNGNHMEFSGQMRAIDHRILVVHSPAKLGKMHFAHHKEKKQRLTGIVHAHIYKDDYELAIGMQNSFETLPNSFDLDAFEGINNVTDVGIQPVTTTKMLPDQQNVTENVMDKNIEGLEASVGDIITDIYGNLSEAEDGTTVVRSPLWICMP